MLGARARLRLAEHRVPEALADAYAARDRAAQLYVCHAVLAGWRIEAVEALTQLGSLTAARRLAHEQLELAEQLGTPGALGAATRVLARVDCDPLPLLERSVEVLRSSPARLEHVRALVDLGAALRRANRRADAREPLSLALDLAERGGMKLLGRRAHAELLGTGARPRRSAVSGPAALTPSEHRIAVLAAQGQSNRSIAERLYVTQRTVETHLTHAFSKLQIATRAELNGAMNLDRARSDDAVPV
jgi:DNA-binding CsgD family transcriptional regulator